MIEDSEFSCLCTDGIQNMQMIIFTLLKQPYIHVCVHILRKGRSFVTYLPRHGVSNKALTRSSILSETFDSTISLRLFVPRGSLFGR